NVATAAALLKRSVNIPDAYHAAGFDFSGTKAFDAKNNYRSKSFLAIPLVNGQDRVIGVLQLLNATHPGTGELVPFAEGHQRVVEALASQAESLSTTSFCSRGSASCSRASSRRSHRQSTRNHRTRAGIASAFPS